MKRTHARPTPIAIPPSGIGNWIPQAIARFHSPDAESASHCHLCPQMILIPRIIQSFISHKVLRCVKLMFGLSFLRRFGGVRFICVRGWGYRVWPVLHWKPDQAKAHTAIAAWRSPACATCVRNGATHPFENDARHEPHLPDIATPAVPNASLDRLSLPRAAEISEM